MLLNSNYVIMLQNTFLKSIKNKNKIKNKILLNFKVKYF